MATVKDKLTMLNENKDCHNKKYYKEDIDFLWERHAEQSLEIKKLKIQVEKFIEHLDNFNSIKKDIAIEIIDSKNTFNKLMEDVNLLKEELKLQVNDDNAMRKIGLQIAMSESLCLNFIENLSKDVDKLKKIIRYSSYCSRCDE